MKEITEHFTMTLDAKEGLCFITARNNHEHQVGFNNNPICLSTDDMRKVADFLIETANKIDADKDFNKK